MPAPRVLLVHASDGRERLRAAFEAAGCRVQSAETASKAVAMLSAEPYDCLVSEFELPGDDGLTLRSAVRQLEPELPFVLFTDSETVDGSVAADSPRDSYVRKNGRGSVDRLVAEVTTMGADAEPIDTESTDTEPTAKRDVSAAEPTTEELARVVEAAPIGISLSDPSLADYPLVYVNEAWEALTGYEADELLGRNPRLLQGPDTDPDTVDRLAAAIEAEEPVSVEIRNYRRDGTPFWNELTVTPIHDDGELVGYVGFQIDVTDRHEAEALAAERAETLADERRTLRRVLDRVDGLLRAVSGVLIESTDREEIERRVPTTIAEETGYAAAWIGTVSADDSEFDVSASSGLQDVPAEPTPIAALPAAVGAAVEADDCQRCSAADGEGSPLDPATVGARRLLVVPLCYGERRYGLLGVYGSDETALDSREQEVFGALGGMIANGLHAVETTRLLTTDHVTELRIELRDASFRLSRLAAAVGGPVERSGTTRTADGDCVLYLTTEAAADAEAVESLPFVETARVVSTTDSTRTLSVRLSTVPPDDRLATFGAVVTETTATADGATLTVELPPHQDVRALLETLRSAYDSVDLRARTLQERRTHPHDEFTAAVEDRLTDRQQAAIEAAHRNGYFEFPRPVDGREIAASMDITRQTFHQHLRAAEGKLVAAYVEAR
ncbi:MAG: bacterio-opsin activator domain-containing protein [Euryarchaeota archaeon]|nr:bacterio-opsin activator domain-containing protein [Euryarchaeota archaeon]